MNTLNKFKVVLSLTFLLITSTFFSNTIDLNPSISISKVKLRLVTVDPISPTTGHAGTIVTINGTGFTSTSTVSLGSFSIPAANILFVSATEIKVTVPCGVTSGYFSVNGVASATLFNYISPSITTSISNLSYCVGTTVPQITLAGTPSAATTPTGLTFNWTNSNNAIGLVSSGVGNISTFTAVNPTLEPITSSVIITPSINGCIGTPKNYTITVNPFPVISPISNSSVCSGTNINQINLISTSPNSGSGTSFTWSGTNNSSIGLSASSGTTSPIPSFTATNSLNTSASSLFTVTPTYQGCVGSPINFNIDVAPTSLGGTLTSTSSICSGSAATQLSLTGQRGVILNWESSSTGNAPWTTIANTSATYQPGILTQTTYYRVAVQSTGCPLAYSNTFVINVNSLPTISGNLSVCNGGTTTLTGSNTPAINAWQSSNIAVASISNTGLVTGISAGTSTITYTNSNGCIITSNFVVNAIPSVPNVNIVQPNCTSTLGSIQFSGLPTSGNWTISPGSIIGAGANYTLNNQVAGTYNFSVRDANSCNSAATTVIITAAPIVPIAPSIGTITQPTCANATGSVVLSGLPTGNWTITRLPGSQTYSNTGSSYTVTNLSPGSYTFSVSNGTCSSLASPNVVIDPTPTQSAPIVGVVTQPTCSVATGSVTLSGLPTGNWTLTRVSDGVTFSNTGSTTTLSGLPSGTYNYTVTNQAGCISAQSNAIVINNQPVSPVAPIANAQSFLTSANATVSNLQIVSSGTPVWYSNAVGGTAITGTTLLSTGIYYASQVVNGCESTLRTAVNVAVFVNSTGGTVSGTTSVCIGTNSTLLSLSGYTGSILNWQSSTVSDFSANVTTINVQSATYTVTNLSTPLYFRAVIQNGISPIAYSTPAFIDIVAQSVGGVLSTSTAICSGQNSGILSLTGHRGTIIRWEQSSDNGLNWTQIANINSTYTSGSLTTTTQYRVLVQNGVCSSIYSNVVTITVKSTPVVTDIPNQQICFGSTKTFGDPFVAGYTYSWSSDSGYTSTLPQVSILFNQVVTQNYTYIVTNTATGCASQDQFQIVVSPLPNASVITNTTICQGNSILIGSNSVTGSTYSWTSTPSGFLSTNSNPSDTPAVSTTYLLEETVTATGCKKTNQVVVTVQPIPVITIVGAPQFNICETTTQVQLNASIVNPYASFVWTKVIGSGSFDNNTILNPIYSPSSADVALGSVTLRLSVIGANPCVATYTQDVVIIIDKRPIANAGLDAVTCGNNPVQLNATGTLNATSLVWTLPTGITGSLNLSNPYIPIYTPSASDLNYVGPINITLRASSNTTCSPSTDTVSVIITPAPVVNAGPPTATICQGNNYTVPVNSATAQNVVASTLLWTKGTGDGTIVGANSLTPTYIPGFNDIQNGTVTLTLSAIGNNPCVTPATDSIILTIVKTPIVNAGADTLVCQGAINVNASIQNAGTILWTVQNGNGNFVDPTAISPIYIPATSDLNTTVTFTVTVTPVNNCGPTVSDSVLYTIKASPRIVVAGNATICQSNSTYQLQATATNTTTITWTTTGSGGFDNIQNEDPIYTLSPGDVAAGSVTFTLTGTQAGCSNTSDQMVLTIQKNPTANAGIAQTICQGDSVTIPGSATNASSFSWIRSGGTGSFNNANTTNPTYISQLTESGTIFLTMVANAIAPCSVSASSNTTITIVPRATADAGSDAQICEGDTYHVTTATASNNIGVQWTTSGDGTFTGGNTISPTYTPGPSDNNNGSVVLTLVATKNFPCNANAVDQMTLVINKIPVITVINPDVNLCVGDPFYIVTGVVPSNYDTLTWSSSGTGNFAPNTSAISPTYFPSASDYTLGTVTLTLTASRNPLNCNSSRSNTITLHFIKKPTADAGPTSAVICEGSSYVTNQAVATNYSNVTWSTSGTGTFTNATTLLATYTPSAADYNLGFVNLTLTANTIIPCSGVVTDVIRLNLQKLPVITLSGVSDSICITQNTYAIGGTSVVNYVANSQVWSTNGTGTFSPSGDPLNPIYNPSVDDLAAGSVSLTITVNSIAPCVVPVSKSILLNFQKVPVASAGPALTKCDTPFLINTATANLSTVSNLVWSTSGTGTFDYTNILAPIYTPSPFDVLNSPITLRFTANAIAPCTVPSVTTLQLTLVKSPTISVTNQLPICEDVNNVTVLGTSVSNYSSFVWSSTTGTTISNTSILNPIVTPSAQDILNNQIVLTITAQPNAPCGVPVSRTVIIPIQKKPTVRAGASETICENSILLTSNAFSSNVTNLHWINNGGDGSFTTSNLNTITEYTPGPNEVASGQVLLTIIGDAIAPCTGTVTSTVSYSIVKNPIVTINPTEVTICETQTSYTVPSSFVTIVNPSSILSHQWTTPNMAGLTGAGTWTPTYTPTAADIATGFVYLTLTVNPIAPCTTPIVRTLKINIVKQAIITFTNDGFFCEGLNKPLTASFLNHVPNSISWTIINGTGSLTGANTASPTYIPASDSGTVVIRISATSLAPCSNVVVQDFTITVVKKPIVAMTTVLDTVCSSQLTYNLTGNTAQFANTIQWTRVNPVGTGTFSNSTILNPVYTFNAADIANGFVILRLTATSTSNCNLSDFKEIRINITKAPTVVTSPTDTVCQGAVYSASATTTNSTSVLWSTVGTSNGLFTNANQLVTQYTPGSNDTTSFSIQITATGNAPCAPVTAVKTVTIQNNPIIDAGIESRINCSTLPFQITGVTGQNLGSILWTSTSTIPGTFSNATVLNPTYTPSASELSAGLPIILRVTAQSVAPCTGSVTDFIVLTLTPNQTVNAGNYPTICEGSSVNLSGSVTNASSYYWTTSGTGTFGSINSLITTYIPGNSDIVTGNVTLTLNAVSNSNCPLVSDSTLITIAKKPIANAGANVSICEGSSYTLAAGDATAQNYTSLSWTATGPGALNLGSINTLTPTYVPALGQTGIVTLTLTAIGNSACGINAVSQKTITIVPQPFVTIPSSKTICEGATLVISNTDASATDFSSLQWTSSNGLGSFSSTTTPATIYTPATGQTGIVTLTLTANSPNGVCPAASSPLVLTIIPKPIVEAGTNGTICQSGTFTVSGASVQNASLYSWSISGPAIIQPGTENTLTPVIVPNAGATGTITATLSATGIGICPVIVTDFITLQINPIPVVNAGVDASICEGTTSFQLNGTGSNGTNYSWTTTGGGTIQVTSNPLTPVYTPSASDYNTSTGVKVITFNLVAATSNGCSSVTDSMLLTLNAKPKINAGIDLLACQDSSSVLLNGATVTNYNSGYVVSWSSSGNGTWNYSGSNSGINPVYNFGSNDTSSVTLTMSALPIASCPQVAVTDSMVITIRQNPSIIVSASQITMCGGTFTLPNLVTVNNGNSILWTNTTGASGVPGVLTNATSLTPIFTPSANEIANGFALLTLTVTPLTGCSVPAVEVIRVNLQPKAVVNAGSDVTACQGQIIILNNGASVQNYATYTWTENGTGTIDPATINTLNPKYIPGINETGIITLTLQATNVAPCIGTVSQTMTITIAPQPTVYAGQDVVICQNSNYSLATATASNNTAILWTSSQNSDGTSNPSYAGGTFTNTSIINPSYTPSQDDINLGYVYLTVKASNVACNSIVTDVIKLTITKGPIVAAGSDATICEGNTFALATATSGNTLTLSWTSSQNSNGTSASTYVGGSFSSATILNPVYTPSIDDINLGHVYLNLVGAGGTNCPNSTSQILLNIVKRPSITTTDVQMCMNTPSIPLVGTASNYQSLNWSVFSGPGTISNNPLNPLNPTFTSGISGLNTVQTSVIRLFVTPNAGCPSSSAIYRDLVVTIQPLPTVVAGINGAVCYTAGTPIAPFTINGTNVTNASSQSWTTNGVGTFSLGTNTIYQSLSNICRTDILTLTANGIGACSTSSVSNTVTLAINCAVASLGSISPNISTICQGTTVTYSVPLNSNILTYNWNVPQGASIVSGQGTNSVQILFSGTISGNLTVAGTNGCGSVTSTLPINITTLPSGTSIVGPSTVCAGSNNNVYTANVIPNATSYVWTLPNGSSITTTTNTLTIAFGLSETSGNLSVRGSNSCGLGAVSSAFPITIIPKPTLSSSLTPTAICSNTLFTYSPSSSTTGCTFSWTRTLQTGISNTAVLNSGGAISEVLINTTTNAVSVVYQYTITTPQGCTNTQNVIVMVNPSSSITSSATPTSICSGSTFNYTPTSASVGAITWTRNLIPGIGVLTSNSGTGAISEVLTNTTNLPVSVVYDLTLPATSIGCTNSSSIPVTVIVNPIPQVTVNTINLCTGSSQSMTATPNVSGTYSYSWTVPPGVTNPGNVSNFSASVAGNYSVIITNTATTCASLSAFGTVTVNPLPLVSVNSPTVCAGANATLTATPSAAGSYTYAWTVPTGVTSPGNVASFTTTVAGTYSVIITNTNTGCASLSASGTVTVNPIPVVSVNSSSICAGATATITATPSLPGTYAFAWTVPVGVTNPGNVASFSASVGGNYSVIITNIATSCFSSGASGTLTVNPLPIVTVNNATICVGETATITATPSTIGSYSYSWVVPNGVNNPGNVSNFNTTVAGNYTVIITNLITSCSSVIATGNVTVIPLPIINVVNPTAVCFPSTVNITNTTTGSSPGLIFTYWNDSAATIGLTNPTAISVSGTYYIKGTNANGCFTIRPVVVVINPQPSATITGTNNFVVCQNGTQPVVTFTGSNGTAPYTFSYQINNGPILTVTTAASSNNVSVIIPNTIAGNYTVALLSVRDSSSSLCTSTNIISPNSAFVLVQQIGTIIPVNQNFVSQTVCQGNAITPIVFNIGGSSTNAFVTGLPAGLNGVFNIASSTVTISGTPLISGVFTYVVNTSGSINGCNTTFSGTLTVNSNDSIIALLPANSSQSVCSNAAIQPIVYNLGGGATGGIVTFSPSQPVGITWQLSGNSITISGISSSIGTFTYTVQSFGICGASTATGVITIKNIATTTLVSGNTSTTLCQGSSFVTPIQFSILPSTASMILSGSLPSGVTFNPITGILTGTPTQSGSFSYTISSNTGCGNSISGVITVNSLQAISFVSGNTNQSACQYSPIDPINFILSSGVTAVTFNPALPAGITSTLVGNNLTISGTPSVSTSLASNYVISTQGVCGAQATYSITFDIRPEATIVLGTGSGAINQAVCQSSAIVPITFTIGGGATGIITPNLPAGLSLTQAGGVYTIQGNPLINGIYNFPITTTGCPKTVFVTISNVNTSVGITLTSAVDTDNQIICQTNFSSPITPIIYTVNGASNVTVSGLPAGVTAVFSSSTGQLIISGTPTQSGVFNYTITSSPCSIVKTGLMKISTPISITSETVTNVSCSSLNDGAISVTIVGGVSFNGQYAIRWTGPNGFQQNQTTITGLQPGQYVLSGTDAIGCPIPTRTYNILPAVPINISLVSSTNVNCNGTLGCANFNITGGSGIYTLFTLQYLDPSSQVLVPVIPANNNYYNICNLRAGRYYLTVKDSRNCITTPPYLFNIYDYSSLSIDTIVMDDNLCQDTPGTVRIKVNSLDTNLSFFYNSVLVPATYLGNSIYELSINNPTVPSGVIKVLNSQNCWVTTTVTTAIVNPNFNFTSSDFRAFGYYSVNGSVQFTNLVDMNNIPAEYAYVVWDFGDNTPFKVFRNPEDLVPNSAGENFETVFHTYTTNGIYEITLTVYNHFGCSRKITKTIVIGTGATMMLPTIFTPNGDGINDLFRPSILGLKDVSMYIYDGWGNIVYEVSSEVALLNSNWGWNGVEKGQSEPKNSDYRYYIIATTINDKKIEKEGRFLLVK